MMKKLLISALIFSATISTVFAEQAEEVAVTKEVATLVEDLVATKKEAEAAGLNAEEVKAVVVEKLVTEGQALKKRSTASRELIAFLIGAGAVAVLGVGSMYLWEVRPLQTDKAKLIKANLALSEDLKKLKKEKEEAAAPAVAAESQATDTRWFARFRGAKKA